MLCPKVANLSPKKKMFAGGIFGNIYIFKNSWCYTCKTRKKKKRIFEASPCKHRDFCYIIVPRKLLFKCLVLCHCYAISLRSASAIHAGRNHCCSKLPRLWLMSTTLKALKQDTEKKPEILITSIPASSGISLFPPNSVNAVRPCPCGKSQDEEEFVQ